MPWRRETSCSVLATAVGEDLAGTAPVALGWLVIEHSGPFGRDALADSRLAPHVVTALADGLAGTGVKIVMARRPTIRQDPHRPRKPNHDRPVGRVWWAWCEPGRVSMFRLKSTDPGTLLALDLAALAQGRTDLVHPEATPAAEPMLLVCTNGRRDACCAALARPLVAALAADPQACGQLLESSHLGGHRFAPGALQLPHGWSHGRLDARAGLSVLAAAREGRIHLPTARGRSPLPSEGQVAEIAVRRTHDLDAFDALEIRRVDSDAPPGTAMWEASDGSGRTWDVAVQARPGPMRPESCGQPPASSRRYEAAVTERRN